eukprot:s1539_g22.t1
MREMENNKAIGGLRNPYRAIRNNMKTWKVGASVRHALIGILKENLVELQALVQGKPFSGFREETAERAAKDLSALMGAPHLPPSPLRVELLDSLLKSSSDPEQDVQDWLKDGFPLGIEKELKVNAIFPVTEEDTKAVEMSRQFPLLTDWGEVDQAENYKSFQDAGEAALEELERVAAAGYATKCHSWKEVVHSAGEGASLTKLGCIQKHKPGGGVKTRLVVDCRRSGINGLMVIRQRVVLSRVSDVAGDWVSLVQEDPHTPLCFAVVDFKDAFYQCRLADAERKHVVVKAEGTTYFILEVVAFGLACGPLLWSRLAAALVRLAQAACWDTARVQCYVDDPVLVVKGQDALARAVNLAVPLLLWQALGCQLSWSKMQFGQSVQWIGFCMTLARGCMTARLAEDKLVKLQAALEELLAHKGVVPVQQLRAVAGLLGWLTSIVKIARPWVGMLWGSVAECEARAPRQARVRKNLVFMKQVHTALRTLSRMTQCGTLVATYHWQPRAMWQIQTDASVFGFGGILWYGRQPVAWWADVLQPCDLALLGATSGDPAWQSECELMAVAISVKLFGPKLASQAVHLTTDNTGVLHTALNLRASSPGMVLLAAELACGLRQFDIDLQQGDHVRSAANYLADALSRLCKGAAVPAQLAPVPRITTGSVYFISFVGQLRLKSPPQQLPVMPCGCARDRAQAAAQVLAFRPYPSPPVRGWGATLLSHLAAALVGAVALLWHFPASQQRRFAGAGGTDHATRKRLAKRREELVATRYESRQREVAAAQEDYAAGPVRLKKSDEFDPWSALAQRVCQLCSRKPVLGYCCKCRVELCGACINRMPTAPFKWICLDCACTSDESGDQAKLLVSCQNEEVARRDTILAQPGMETEEELAGAERILGDKGRHLEMAWWAEVKRKDWGLHLDRPVMPHAVMKGYADCKFPHQVEESLPSAGSGDLRPHDESDLATVAFVKSEPKEDDSPSGVEGSLRKKLKTGPGRAAEKELQGLKAPTTPAGTPAARRGRGDRLPRLCRNLEPFLLTPAVIGEVGAVLRAADFASGASYLNEAKQLHLRKGFEWDNAFDLAMQDAERALTRALGPVVKAEEIPPKLWRLWQETGRRGFAWKDMQPDAGPELWGMGSAFLLREIGLAHLLMGSVTLDMGSREATLLLSMSKTDPSGRGAKRTCSCTCSRPAEDEGELDCPFHSTVLVVAGRTRTLRRLGYSEEELKDFTVVGQVSCPTIMVSKDSMIAALRKDVEAMCAALQSTRHNIVPPKIDRVTGHSLRRSGAKDAVKRHGLPLAMVQWLGRWGSSAVQGYVEDALEEMPKNKVALTTWEGLARKTIEQAGKFEEVQNMIEAVKSEVKASKANTEAMVQ